MRIRESQWWFGSLKWMRLLQFSHQELFVDLLLVSVAIQIQIEGFSKREVRFLFVVRFRKIVFEDRLFHVQHLMEDISHAAIPIGLEKCETGRCDIFLVLSIKV